MEYPKTSNEFGVVDYVVFAIFLLVSCGIGIFFSLTGGRQKSTEEFLMGNRKMRVIPTAISMLVSFTSAILILGTPSEMYQNGTMYAMSTVGESLSCVLSAVLFVPIFYPLKLTSSYEYLELRFKSRFIRRFGNILYMINQVVYMGIAMYAPSTAMEFVTGGRLRTEYAIILCGLVGTFYTALGGMKAVIWSDVFQAAVMLTGIIAIVVQGAIRTGGLDKAFVIAGENQRLEFDNISLDPRERHTWWVLTIGLAIGWSGTYGTNQAAVQRYCALPTLSKARASILTNILGGLILNWSTCLAGVVIFAYYASVGCDPVAAGYVSNQNQIVPYFVMDILNVPAVPGIFIAALFAGALSSVSSSLSAMSAITWKDFLEIACFPNASELTGAIITKVLVIIFGVCGIGMGFVAIYLSGSVLQASLSFSGALGSPILGLFLLGVLFRHVNKYGAIVGSLLGLCMSVWVNIGAYVSGKPSISLPTNISMCVTNATVNIPTAAPDVPGILDDLYSVSYLWLPLFGALTTIAVGLLVSGVTGSSHDVDERLVHSAATLFCCCYSCGCRDKRAVYEMSEVAVGPASAGGGDGVRSDEPDNAEQKT